MASATCRSKAASRTEATRCQRWELERVTPTSAKVVVASCDDHWLSPALARGISASSSPSRRVRLADLPGGVHLLHHLGGAEDGAEAFTFAVPRIPPTVGGILRRPSVLVGPVARPAIGRHRRQVRRPLPDLRLQVGPE